MEKVLAGIIAALFICLFILFFGMTFYSAGRQYNYTDRIYWWLYTPAQLKKAPLLSNNITYSYSYDIDTQEVRAVITYEKVSNIEIKKQQLIDFISTAKVFKKYDCTWVYNNPNDYSTEYQRYCVYQKGDALQLELYQIP